MKLRRSILLIAYVIIFMFINVVGVRAATKGETYYDDSGQYNFTSKITEEKELALGTTYIHDEGTTNRGGEVYEQDLFVLLQESNAENGLKVVSWGGYNQNHTVSTALPRMTLKEIAKDYEANHPGWKVVGGINADQYCWGYGTEISKGYDILENRTFYPMKADGEYWFSNHFNGHNSTNVVGFLNDGTANALVYNDAASNTEFKLSVYDENNNLLGKFDITDMNPVNKVSGEYTYVYALADTGNTSTPINRQLESKEKTISSSNDLYIISNADKTWVSNSVEYDWFKNSSNENAIAVNQFFGKGTIDQVAKSTTITATQFAIETTDSELLALLDEGCYVIAQHEYYGGYENCESAVGFHTVQRLDNVDRNVANSYNTRGYPRSVVGITNDGKIALINGNGTSKSGFYAQEINAVCKAYNIKTAFQMDGGGSATMIIRDDNGDFITVNEPSDGSDRSIYPGLFFVVKDSQSEITTSNITQDGFDLDVNILDYGIGADIEKTFMHVSGKKDGKPYEDLREVVNGKVSFDGLDPNIEYVYTLKYQVAGMDKMIKTFNSGKVTTAKEVPSIKLLSLDYEDGELKIRVLANDPNQAITGYIGVSFDGGENYYNFDASKFFIIEDFKGNPFIDTKILLKYNINDGKDKQEIILEDFEIEYTFYVFIETMFNGISNSIIDGFTNDSE